jgi:glutamate transport system substrate-binding protein
MRAGALAAATSLALVACGNGDDDADVAEVQDVEAADFPEGSTMARLAEAGRITIGTKFDQPLFGLQPPTGDPEGFDVEIGRMVAAALGIDDDGMMTETVAFTNEAEAREGERRELSAEGRELMKQEMSLIEDVHYLDLHSPWFASHR